MHYLNISFTHKNSTLDIREKLSYSDNDKKRECLTHLLDAKPISEAILISTCNRMEVLCNCNDIPSSTEHILEILSKHSGISVKELVEHADIVDDSSAIHHLFSVAASLDSMVIGETQIVGQLKDAFRFAYDNQFCGKKLARAMKSAFKCAATVRNATDISSKPVSMASVAVAKLKSLMNSVEGKKVLIIGVGEMSEITAKHLISAGADVYIMNRTKHKAEALALECSAKVIDFNELWDAINNFEILYTATSSNEPIIIDEMIQERDFDRYWFDLALPRDIKCSENDKIHLHVIDDLKIIVDENLSSRENASRAAHGIIGRGIVEFFEWLNTQDIEPVIKEIYNRARVAAKEESVRAISSGYIPREYQDEAKKMCEQSIKRFLHSMTDNMRNSTEDEHAELISGAMSSIMKENSLRERNEKK